MLLQRFEDFVVIRIPAIRECVPFICIHEQWFNRRSHTGGGYVLVLLAHLCLTRFLV